MPKPWSSQPREVLEEWLKACLWVKYSKLTDWERDFCTSLEDQLERRGTLTQKQQEILERIYAERTD